DGLLLTASSPNHFPRGASANVRLWGAALQPPAVALTVKAFVNAAAFSPDGRHFATAGQHAMVWDRSGRRLATLYHQRPVPAAPFSRDGRLLLTRCGGSLYLSDEEWGRLKKSAAGRAADATAATFLWDVAGGKLLHSLGTEPGETAAFSPDGR